MVTQQDYSHEILRLLCLTLNRCLLGESKTSHSSLQARIRKVCARRLCSGGAELIIAAGKRSVRLQNGWTQLSNDPAALQAWRYNDFMEKENGEWHPQRGG
ncbi:hypothetical protein M513_08931 [Trichuris suis]|uniref:Uncharacterized protein n=1 Tax=Trichuris suis TaxID=68888 RepID=A0A085LYZ0_9BILA|nr:hypothetical protein M513_08931 [Trichuris suis]